MIKFHRCYCVKTLKKPSPNLAVIVGENRPCIYAPQVRFRFGLFFTPWRGELAFADLSKAEENCVRMAQRYCGNWRLAAFEFDAEAAEARIFANPPRNPYRQP